MIMSKYNREIASENPDPEAETKDRTIPVSYTHLDVYKRQVLVRRGLFLVPSAIKVQCISDQYNPIIKVFILIYTIKIKVVQ